MTLTNFPRGGKKTEKNFIVSNKNKAKPKKKNSKIAKGKEKVQGLCDEFEHRISETNTTEDLRYISLYKGMIILGRIYKVSMYDAVVSLPGQLSGKLLATDISETYTSLLKSVTEGETFSEEFKTLPEMFKKGDYVVCYIKELSENHNISLSLEPSLINERLNPKLVFKSSKVVFAIKSIEDHGYVMETGLNSFRAFLSKKDVENPDLILCPGKQIVCAIKDLQYIENVYTSKVSIKIKHLSTVESKIPALDNIRPGSQISVVVKRILKNGLKVSFGSKNVGFINQIYLSKSLNSFSVGQELIATFLYLIPTVKFSYFSLLSGEEIDSIDIGTIIGKAKVISREKRGILLRLKKGIKGFVPNRRTDVDFAKIPTTFLPDKTCKCRILSYDLMQKIYICTMEKSLLTEKYFDKSNLQAGDIVEVEVKNILPNKVLVNVGKISGFVPSDQLADPGSKSIVKNGQKLKARVLHIDEQVIFTLKTSLVESKLPILAKINETEVGSVHDGTVIKISKSGILVKFFGDVIGFLPAKFLPKSSSKTWNMTLGQTIKTIIKEIDLKKNRITLALTNTNKSSLKKYNIGDIVEGVVIDSSTNGLQIQIFDESKEVCIGFLPAGHMSPCSQVGKLLALKTVPGEKIKAIVYSVSPDVILSTTFVPEKTFNFEELQTDQCLMCSVQSIKNDAIDVLIPINASGQRLYSATADSLHLSLIHQNQILYGKVLKVDKKFKKLTLTTQLSKIWKDIDSDTKAMSGIDLLTSYLNKIYELSTNIYYKSKSISSVSIGQKIKGVIENIIENVFVLKLDNNLKGFVRKSHHSGKYKVGDTILGTILWINYPDEYLEVTLVNHFVNSISIDQKVLPLLPVGIQMKAEILFATEWFILAIVKRGGNGYIAAMPIRRHLNDIKPDVKPYVTGTKFKCYVVLNSVDADTILPICMIKSAFEIKLNESQQFLAKRKNNAESEVVKKKAKIIDKNQENIEKLEKVISKNSSDEIVARNIDSDISDLESDGEANKEMNINFGEITKSEYETVTQTLPECGFVWDDKSKKIQLKESSSESEEDEESLKLKKKKKLSAAERREVERQKEREIREREEALAKNDIPQSVDQFDRLILSSPNSSIIWVQYMTYHLQAAEIEKAKAVAKRAIKTINFREEGEKLNVYQAWLNLESRFGTLESLNQVFQEAVSSNDAEKVYMHMLKVHTDAGRQNELEKLINTILGKYKNNQEMWTECGSAFLKMGLKDKSRHIMQRALQSLPAYKHVDLMVKFAQLENKFGDKERSQTLFEQILSSYPKRTDVWSSYVDSLVKSNNLDIARKVLERAVHQPLPAKKMKTILKKYINFEKIHGTPENISHVQEIATKYVAEQCNKNVE